MCWLVEDGLVSVPLAESSAQERELVRKPKEMGVGMEPSRGRVLGSLAHGGGPKYKQLGTVHALKIYQQCRAWGENLGLLDFFRSLSRGQEKKYPQSNVFLSVNQVNHTLGLLCALSSVRRICHSLFAHCMHKK